MPAIQTVPTFPAPCSTYLREGHVRVPLRSVDARPVACTRLRYRLLGDIGAGVRQDRLDPASDLRDLAAASGAGLTLIDSVFGHDAFLKERQRVGRWLHRHLDPARRMRRRA